MMARQMETILNRYGQQVTVFSGGEGREAKAFLQPWPERGERETCMELGTVDEGLWRYLGRTAVEPGDLVAWAGRTFRVRSSRPYAIGQTLVYWWAALERAKEAAE